MTNFHDTSNRLPPSRFLHRHPSWFAIVLSFVEGRSEFNLWTLDKTYYDQVNKIARETVISKFRCAPWALQNLTKEGNQGGAADTSGAVGDYVGHAETIVEAG